MSGLTHGKALRFAGPVPAVADETRSTRREVLTPVGDQLRAERERRGVTLTEVVNATKIRRSYLEALERHDWDALPASVFARGYLRSYAEHLGLNSERLLSVYERQRRLARASDPSTADQDESEGRAILEQIARARGIDTRPSWRWLIWNVIALPGIVAAAAVVWVALSRSAPGPTNGPAIPAGTSPSAASSVGIAPTARSDRTDPTAVDAPDDPPAMNEVTRRAEPQRSIAVAATVETPASPSARPGPTSVPEPEMPAHAPTPGRLTVPEFGIGTNVANPMHAAGPHRFEVGSVLWFRASVHGGRTGDTIRHLWRHGERPVAVAPIDLHGETWPTESRLQLLPDSIGDWTVEARDAKGRVLARVPFTCVPNADVTEDR